MCITTLKSVLDTITSLSKLQKVVEKAENKTV